MKVSVRKAIMEHLKAAGAIADAAVTEDRDLTEDERAKVTEHMGKAQALKKSAADADELAKELADLNEGLGLAPEQPQQKAADFTAPTRGDSIGTAFTKSPEFDALMKSVPSGRFSEKSRVQSAPFGVKSLITGVADSSAGALLMPQQLGLLDPSYARPLTVRDLFTQGTTGTDQIEYVRLLSTTNNAAPVPEATSAGVIGAGDPVVTTVAAGVKPESGFTLEKLTTNVKTIAHWIPATKRSLSDAAQVKTLIDTFLRYGLEEEFEDQLIGGDGVGENFLGINATSGIQDQAAPTGAEDVFTVTRRARRKVRIGGRATPTAYVLNPIDWENIELMRNADGNFYGAGPFAMTPNTLWGLPVVESEAVAAGTGWVADWKMGIVWDREQASIQVTDSHADFFVRNLVAILAEMRAAFALLRPAAFVRIDLAA